MDMFGWFGRMIMCLMRVGQGAPIAVGIFMAPIVIPLVLVGFLVGAVLAARSIIRGFGWVQIDTAKGPFFVCKCYSCGLSEDEFLLAIKRAERRADDPQAH